MSCILDDATVREEVRFIENNPVRAKLVGDASNYRWSSTSSHVIGASDQIISGDCFLNAEIADWRAYLENNTNEDLVERTRTRLKTGRPAGDIDFVRILERIAGRSLEALPRGRPRKSEKR